MLARRAILALAIVVALAHIAAAQSGQDKKTAERARYKFYDAPPLTPQKAAYINRLIEMMVLDDLGKLNVPGMDRAALRREFEALQVDALPLLVRWMDAAAALG